MYVMARIADQKWTSVPIHVGNGGRVEGRSKEDSDLQQHNTIGKSCALDSGNITRTLADASG